ncbi:L domain-like protein [Xylariaceae sp. FL0804]|nr:L domain-like protein [Xylariaceae sp. FL0804]
MRLTAELLQNSPSWLNALKERELDLRGHRIPAIENLGVAGPQDAIDFVDNDIQVLGNFPLSPRIRSLLLQRNRVSAIQPTLAHSIPNLTSLQLESNNLAELADLDPLGSFPFLTHLVLRDNPVTRKEHYRYWILWRCPALRFLDYQKVKAAEREQARELFGAAAAEPTELASRIMGVKSKTFDASVSSASTAGAATTNGGSGGSGGLSSRMARIKLTEQEKRRLQDMIKKATSLDEITRLEVMLREGRMPAGIHVADEMEE